MKKPGEHLLKEEDREGDRQYGGELGFSWSWEKRRVRGDAMVRNNWRRLESGVKLWLQGDDEREEKRKKKKVSSERKLQQIW